MGEESQGSGGQQPTDLEFVVEGSEAEVRGFVLGLFLGARADDWPVFPSEFGLERLSRSEALRQWVDEGSGVQHFIVAARSRDLLEDALRDPRARPIGLRDVRPVRGARFDFVVRLGADEDAAPVLGVLAAVPASVQIEGWPSRDGAELNGAGTASGPFRELLYVHEQCRHVPSIRVELLQLDLGPSLGL
jgi:hypothetical protein